MSFFFLLRISINTRIRNDHLDFGIVFFRMYLVTFLLILS